MSIKGLATDRRAPEIAVSKADTEASARSALAGHRELRRWS